MFKHYYFQVAFNEVNVAIIQLCRSLLKVKNDPSFRVHNWAIKANFIFAIKNFIFDLFSVFFHFYCFFSIKNHSFLEVLCEWCFCGIGTSCWDYERAMVISLRIHLGTPTRFAVRTFGRKIIGSSNNPFVSNCGLFLQEASLRNDPFRNNFVERIFILKPIFETR